MADRIAHTAGTAVAWMLIVGVAANLAPEAAREVREVASELADSLRRRLPRRPATADDLARQIRELTPVSRTW